MCTVCGCATDEQAPVQHGNEHENAHEHAHEHGHGHGHAHGQGHVHEHDDRHGHPQNDEHAHEHEHEHAHEHASTASGPIDNHRHPTDATAARLPGLDFGGGLAGVHIPGLSQQRIIRIEQGILGKNDRYAASNRRRLEEAGSFALNLVSSPGSGKTSLLVKTIEALRGRLDVAVIEGDQQTSNDAERIRASGARAIQVNTGKGCHLDAHMVELAMTRLHLKSGGALFIENVGNLVCPAAFDLGEAHKVVILSVTEGEDKPLKYPDMFRAASLMILSKIDLLPHLEFDLAACLACARRVHPSIQILQLSARTGQGVAAWVDWIVAGASVAQRKAAAGLATGPAAAVPCAA